MSKVRSILFTLLLLSASISYAFIAEPVTLITYNTGLLKKYFVNLVPCVSTRTYAQVRTVEEMLQSKTYFAIALQEVWTRKGFKAYKAMAEKNGYKFWPEKYKKVKKNGQMIITNLDVIQFGFQEFNKDMRVDRGIRWVDLSDGISSFRFANIHTSYSDSSRPNPEQISQLADIKEFAALNSENGLVIAGDYNAGPGLNYEHTDWDHTEVLWEQNTLFPLNDEGLEVISQQSEWTWNSEINPMINKPTFLIRLYSFFKTGKFGWDDFNAVIDHVFSNIGTPTNAKLDMDFEVSTSKRCRGRSRENNLMYMSDHFANSVDVIDI